MGGDERPAGQKRTRRQTEPRMSWVGEDMPPDRLLTDDEMAERFVTYGMTSAAADAAVRFIRRTPH